MVLSIHIGFRHCGKRTISVIVDYTIKSRQLNPTTVIFVVNVELLDGGEVKNQWCIRFLEPITETSHVSFYNFLDRFIWKVLITDFVLSLIGALELMEFKNKISQINFHQKQTSLDILKDYMFSKRITIIEHDDFYFNAGSNNEPHIYVFRFKQDDEEFVSDKEVSRELGPNYISPCSQLTLEADIRNAKQRILERRKNNLIDRTTVKTEPSIKTVLSERMQGIFCY